jgi:ferredoxin-type protein NapH
MKRLSSANLRALAILLVFLVIALGYVARLDVGNLSTFGFGIVSAICPLGFLETTLAERSLIPRALLSFGAIVLITILLGRAFCSWICPVPLIQRWFPGRKKQARELAEQIDNTTKAAESSEAPAVEVPLILSGGKARNLKLDSRHVVLGGTLLSAAVFGFPVFCLICPIGLTFATLLVVLRLFGAGEMTWALLVFPLILILELVVFRKWCSKICPLGALISLISGVNRLLRPRIDDSKCLATARGIDCAICHRACTREDIDLRRPATSSGALSDCTKCRECADACPTRAISFPLLPKKH